MYHLHDLLMKYVGKHTQPEDVQARFQKATGYRHGGRPPDFAELYRPEQLSKQERVTLEKEGKRVLHSKLHCDYLDMRVITQRRVSLSPMIFN